MLAFVVLNTFFALCCGPELGPILFISNRDEDGRLIVVNNEQLLTRSLHGFEANSSQVELRHYRVVSVSWKGHYKRLRLEPGKYYLNVPLSACVSQNDQIILADGAVSVICKYGEAKLLPVYAERELLNLGGLGIDIVVKEITELDEYQAYQSLAHFHYRGKVIHGRTAKLILRAFHPMLPKVLGYVELATPLYMNKARANILNAPFKQNGISWQTWNMDTTRRYIHLLVRIARCVVYPEFRGLGLGQMLVKHASEFAANRWQVAGLKPVFLEIAADMLKFVPFAEKAGLHFIGETEGNLKRVYEDMEYLMRNSQRIEDGEIVQEESCGIVDQQVARMRRAFNLIEQEGITIQELLERLQHLSQESVLRDYALFHEIVSLPKPTYIQGLTSEAKQFISERAEQLVQTNDRSTESPTIQPISSHIQLQNVKITFRSQVRRTQQTHAVQQAFGISPDSIQTIVLRNFSISIIPGQVVLVIGPSGSGKTTLLDTLAYGREKDHAEDILVEGKLEFPDNYRPGVFEPIRSKKALIEVLADKSVDKALHLMGLVGLSDAYVYLKRFDELSKGQQFRAMLARLIASDVNVWLVDEFCANLDPVTANVVADKLQRTARKLGATLIAATPNCEHFLASFKPDVVIQLTTAWEQSILEGDDFLQQMLMPQIKSTQIQILRLRSEYLRAIRYGEKRTTIRKGRCDIKQGLLLFECGSDRQVVNVTSVKYCLVEDITFEDAKSDGFADLEALIAELRKIYPGLQNHHQVSIIHFNTMVAEPRDYP